MSRKNKKFGKYYRAHNYKIKQPHMKRWPQLSGRICYNRSNDDNQTVFVYPGGL